MPDPDIRVESGELESRIRAVFGDQAELAGQFHELLAGAGIDRGLIGPREADRLWDRHILNCAVLTDLLPRHARIVDIGSGAGLPGLVLAIRRPDLQVDLVESLQRRTEFLSEAVATLALGSRVRVIRGRAEEPATVAAVGSAPWVTARAVAPLDRLVRWCLPLLRPGGSLLAMKGASADAEVAEHAAALRRAGADVVEVTTVEGGSLDQATTVVQVRRAPRPDRPEDLNHAPREGREGAS